jgi:hypothetical protein
MYLASDSLYYKTNNPFIVKAGLGAINLQFFRGKHPKSNPKEFIFQNYVFLQAIFYENPFFFK